MDGRVSVLVPALTLVQYTSSLSHTSLSHPVSHRGSSGRATLRPLWVFCYLAVETNQSCMLLPPYHIHYPLLHIQLISQHVGTLHG